MPGSRVRVPPFPPEIQIKPINYASHEAALPGTRKHDLAQSMCQICAKAGWAAGRFGEIGCGVVRRCAAYRTVLLRGVRPRRFSAPASYRAKRSGAMARRSRTC